MILTHKNQTIKNLNLNISASLVETFARLIIFDPDNFVKYFSCKKILAIFYLCLLFLLYDRKFLIVEKINSECLARVDQFQHTSWSTAKSEHERVGNDCTSNDVPVSTTQSAHRNDIRPIETSQLHAQNYVPLPAQ